MIGRVVAGQAKIRINYLLSRRVRWSDETEGDLVMNFLNSLVIFRMIISVLYFSRSVSLALCDQGQRRSTEAIVIRDESLAHNATT